MGNAFTLEQIVSEEVLTEGLKVSSSTMYRLRQKGCPHIRLGKHVFYFEPDFVEWLATQQKRGAVTKNNGS